MGESAADSSLNERSRPMAKYDEWLTPDGLLQLEAWARDGLTSEQIANNCGVALSTLYEWVRTKDAIKESLVTGKYGKYIEQGYEVVLPKSLKKEAYFKDKQGTVHFMCGRCKKLKQKEELISSKKICKHCVRKESVAYRASPRGKQVKKKHAKQYYKENKEAVYKMVYRRHTAMRNQMNDYQEGDWEDAVSFFNGACAYCGKVKRLEREHIVPVSKHGPYTRSNIVPACRACNMKKLNYEFNIWYLKQPFYSKDRHEKIRAWQMGNKHQERRGQCQPLNGQKTVKHHGTQKDVS